MGPFSKVLTVDQIQKFEVKDMIILDPLQSNVHTTVKALSTNLSRRHHIIGRLDLQALLHSSTNVEMKEAFIISAIDSIFHVVTTRFKTLDGSSNGFTGILLAGWEVFPVMATHELSSTLATHGLDVYLETSGPDFLKDHSTLNSESIAGLIMRNAFLRPNGERLDCFDMGNLRTTVKAFVSQACLRSFAVLAWETLDDGVSLSPAILKRTYALCSFYNVVPWIGSCKGVYHLSADIVYCQPLGAFDWLKQTRVMELHDTWRSLRNVSIREMRQIGID